MPRSKSRNHRRYCAPRDWAGVGAFHGVRWGIPWHPLGDPWRRCGMRSVAAALATRMRVREEVRRRSPRLSSLRASQDGMATSRETMAMKSKLATTRSRAVLPNLEAKAALRAVCLLGNSCIGKALLVRLLRRHHGVWWITFTYSEFHCTSAKTGKTPGTGESVGKPTMNARLHKIAGGFATALAVLMLAGPALADGMGRRGSIKDAPKPEETMQALRQHSAHHRVRVPRLLADRPRSCGAGRL